MCVTYYVDMNITLAIDEQLVKRARKIAQAQGKSLNQYIREQLERLTARDDAEGWIEEFERLSSQSKGNSSGWTFDRDAAHDRR
jgi:hypothetical protein